MNREATLQNLPHQAHLLKEQALRSLHRFPEQRGGSRSVRGKHLRLSEQLACFHPERDGRE
jgi:hypothetical protein